MTATNCLNDQIRVFRKKHNLTQEQLAEVLNVSIGAVSKWESGQNTPELSMIIRLARLFEVSVDVLIGYEVESLNLDESLEKINELISTREFEEVLSIVQKLLFKYPNNFRVIAAAAKSYTLAANNSQDPSIRNKYFQEALVLQKKSLNLLDQNSDPAYSESSIKANIARILIRSDENKIDQAVAILEQINSDRLYSGEIGSWLSNKSSLNDADQMKAYEHLQYGLLHAISALINTSMGYLNLYMNGSVMEYAKALDISTIAQAVCLSLSPGQETSYMDRIRIAFIVSDAIALEYSGESQKSLDKLQEAKRLADSYDRDPSVKIKTLHLSEENSLQAFDDLGPSMVELIDDMIRDNLDQYGKNQEMINVLEAWKKLQGK